MPAPEHLVTFLIATVVLVLVPGPTVVFVVSQAIVHGRRAALASVAGNSLGVYLLVVAVAFGIGMGLTLDEFALWLNLEDVYWSPKGRQSIDAVILAACLLAVALFGLQFWIDLYEAFLVLAGAGGERLVGGESALVLAPAQALGVVMAGAALLKGKLFTGIVGMFVPVVGLVGGVRLAKPDSRWARRYDADKLGRSKRRFANAG